MVLGLASVHGELLICVSLGHLLGLEPSAEAHQSVRGTARQRLLVIRRDQVRAVCPVDEVHGIHRFHPRELKDVPTTVARAAATYSKALLSWRDRSVGLLDDELLVSQREAERGVSARDLTEVSLFDLFRLEAETQTQVLTSGLLALERDHAAVDQLEACMRAAHSLKGAASIVGLTVGVRVAHAMEDCFVAAQQGRITLGRAQIDLLLGGTDLLMRIASTPEPDLGAWAAQKKPEVDGCLSALARILENPAELPLADSQPVQMVPQRRAYRRCGRVFGPRTARHGGEPQSPARPGGRIAGRVAMGEAVRRIACCGSSGCSTESSNALVSLRDALRDRRWTSTPQAALADAQHHRDSSASRFWHSGCSSSRCSTAARSNLSHRLYDEALACRMRPFADGVQGFPRMVRDLARSLGKQVKLDIIGETTQVDRDILGKLDAPLGHLLRNAVDHGLESPDERRAAGKPAEGVLRLEARHSAGALHVIVSDDGRGVDLDKLRRAVVERNLVDVQAGAALSEAELLEFLFLPGFSMKDTVTDISGRGVGLDVVQDMVKQVRGTVRVSSQPGRGTRFQLQLPVTLSVVRTLLVEVGGEPYAFPLAHIVRTLKLSTQQIELLEGRQHFDFDGRRIGLVTAQQVLETGEGTTVGDELRGDRHRRVQPRLRPGRGPLPRRARAGRAAARRRRSARSRTSPPARSWKTARRS